MEQARPSRARDLFKGLQSSAERRLAVPGNRVVLLRDGLTAFPAMHAAIAGAQEEILLAMYWFASDHIGRLTAGLMSQACQRGVRVSVLYDGVGSIATSSSMFSAMRACGARVLEYHTPMPWSRRFRLANLNYRDHRKLLVVDGKKAFVGGINIADPWLPYAQGGQQWRDDTVEIEGPVVAAIRSTFIESWHDAGGESGIFKALPQSPPVGQSAALALLQNRRRNRRDIRRAYVGRMRKAKERIFIANSYFVPDRTIRSLLARAVKHGVDVRVLVPQYSDVLVAQWASHANFTALLSSGVQIYQWHESMMHSKTAVIDSWCTIGSSNLDHRSFRLSLELNIAIDDPNFTDQVAKSLEGDFERSHRLTLQQHNRRSIIDRIMERVCLAFRVML